MRRNTISILALCIVGLMACGYTANGGLFFNRQGPCTPPHIEKPPEVPFPIDELVVPPPCVGPDCPDCPVEPTFPIVEPTFPDTPDPIIDSCEPVDIDAIVAEVLAKLPPVRMEIHHPNGEIYTQSKPLGVAIRLKLVPK